MTYYILHNPLAGNGVVDLDAHIAAFSEKGSVVRVDITTIKSYEDFLAPLAPEDVIVLCGGDGTVNRFVNDTEGLELPWDVLYIPCGTGNDLLRDLDVQVSDCPISLKKYIENLPIAELKGKRYRFLNNLGFGIDGYCCEVGDELKRKQPDKRVNYTAVAIKGLLFHFKPVTATVIVDGVKHVYKKAWLAPTMKGRFYGGGMMATPAQDRTDPEGTLSVMLFYGKGRLATLMAFPSIFKGEHIKRTDMVAIHTGKDIRVSFDGPRAVQIDGETILDVTEYHAYTAGVTVAEEALDAATV